MSNSKNYKVFKAMKNISFITQFGFSIISPPLILVWLAIWINSKFNLGDWLVLAGILLGLASSFYSAVSFYKYACRQAEKSQDGEDDEGE